MPKSKNATPVTDDNAASESAQGTATKMHRRVIKKYPNRRLYDTETYGL